MSRGSPFCAIVVPEPVHHAGQDLRGHVFVNVAAEHLADTKVELALVGVSRTHLRLRDQAQIVHDGRSRLLFQHAILTPGSTSQNIFPFNFIVPVCSKDWSTEPISGPRWQPGIWFQESRSIRELPPSYSCGGYTFKHAVGGTVLYELVARVHSPIFGSHETKLPVNFKLAAVDVQREGNGYATAHRRFVVRSDELIQANGKSSLSRLFAKGTSKPELDMNLHADIPKHICLGQPIRLDIHANPSTQHPDLIDPPEIDVDCISAELRYATYFRSNRTNEDGHKEASARTVLSNYLYDGDELKPTKNSPDEIKLSADNGFMAHIVTKELPEDKLTPSFYTYNIALAYTLDLTISVSCAGKSFKLTHSQPVTIDPAMPLCEGPNGEPPPFMRRPRATTTDSKAVEEMPLSSDEIESFFTEVEKDTLHSAEMDWRDLSMRMYVDYKLDSFQKSLMTQIRTNVYS